MLGRFTLSSEEADMVVLTLQHEEDHAESEEEWYAMDHALLSISLVIEKAKNSSAPKHPHRICLSVEDISHLIHVLFRRRDYLQRQIITTQSAADITLLESCLLALSSMWRSGVGHEGAH